MKSFWLACLLGLAGFSASAANPTPAMPYAFGVLNQRSLQLTAAYWNPILGYVTARTGIPLELHIGRTANETTDKIVRGEIDLAYTNHLFTPKRSALGWRVLARQDSTGIRGQVVVLASSAARRLADLQGQAVAFANPYAYAGYYVPMDSLLRANVTVTPVFAGNQEAAMGQLLAGQVAAAGVNHQVMADFARRKQFQYRVLADSEPYFDLAIMASPRVSEADGEKIRRVFVGMKDDPEGARVLARAAEALGQEKSRGFAQADDRDYANYQRFFKQTRVPVNE